MKSSSLKILSLYVFLIAMAIVGYLYINSKGKALEAANALLGPDNSTAVSYGQIFHILFALIVILVVARLTGALFSLIHQPMVIGEVVGGIILGPSILGKFAPEVSGFLLPTEMAPFLSAISQLGLIFYMFLVGLELDLKVFKKSGHATLAISHASIIFPFLLGSTLALYIFNLAPEGVGFTSFSLFIGISMSITAFPVLARILTDKKLSKTKLGSIAITCAAIDDVTAWCLLALVVSIIQANMSNAVSTFVMTVTFILVAMIFLKPLVGKLIQAIEKKDFLSENMFAVICLGLMFFALIAEYIGIHAIFGAFLFGAIIPHESKVAVGITHKLQDFVRIVFLPAFFAFSGMRTEIGLLTSYSDWILCLVIILIACIGKFGGTLIAAKWSGLAWKESSALGVLMNTRGLVELIVLNIGLDLKVITPRLFTMFVIMALVTTFLTGPLLYMILGADYHKNKEALI